MSTDSKNNKNTAGKEHDRLVFDAALHQLQERSQSTENTSKKPDTVKSSPAVKIPSVNRGAASNQPRKPKSSTSEKKKSSQNSSIDGALFRQQVDAVEKKTESDHRRKKARSKHPERIISHRPQSWIDRENMDKNLAAIQNIYDQYSGDSFEELLKLFTDADFDVESSRHIYDKNIQVMNVFYHEPVIFSFGEEETMVIPLYKTFKFPEQKIVKDAEGKNKAFKLFSRRKK